jgi:hypothetical protein
MAGKKLNRTQQAVAGLLAEFSRVSTAEGIGPCTLAAIVLDYAKAEEYGPGFFEPIRKAASAESERIFAEQRARVDGDFRPAGVKGA